MRKKDFFNFIEKRYTPIVYEINPQTMIKPQYRAYAYSGVELYYEIYKAIRNHISNDMTIVDVGAYPGTFLRILQNIITGNGIKFYGMGLVFARDEIAQQGVASDAG